MAIKNYTTRVNPERTISEIGALLARKGARRVSTEYGLKGQIDAVSFEMEVGGVSVHFRLPSNIPGVARALSANGKPTDKQLGHAVWVSWRIVKDWIDAQMALIESNQAEPGQVFLPYAIPAKASGDTRSLYELFVENNQKQLGVGK